MKRKKAPQRMQHRHNDTERNAVRDRKRESERSTLEVYVIQNAHEAQLDVHIYTHTHACR